MSDANEASRLERLEAERAMIAAESARDTERARKRRDEVARLKERRRPHTRTKPTDA